MCLSINRFNVCVQYKYSTAVVEIHAVLHVLFLNLLIKLNACWHGYNYVIPNVISYAQLTGSHY